MLISYKFPRTRNKSDLLVIVLFADDVSLLVLLLDTNPLFWSSTSITFSQFLSHVSVSNDSIVCLFNASFVFRYLVIAVICRCLLF